MLLGCIADDFTGATDLANTLARGGMRTTLCIGVPGPDRVTAWGAAPRTSRGSTDTNAGAGAREGAIVREDADALVVALKSRTIPAAEAIGQSLAACRWLREAGARQWFFKYCSTFDSTDAGNIGPVADALMSELGTDFSIACPAFPENGRSVYRGHLFVGDALLSESGMERHPLTPMTDANLVRVLQRQTTRRVGLVRFDAVAQGAQAVAARFDALRRDGVGLAIVDALSDEDLYRIGEACATMPLVTGGSGVAIGLPRNFRTAGRLAGVGDATAMPEVPGLAAVISGSCSRATNAQVAAWTASRPAMRIDPLALAAREPVVERTLEWAQAQLGRGPVLIYATSAPEEVAAVQRELGADAAGALVEDALAAIARGLVGAGVRRLVVAGGETSGAVVKALGIERMRVGPQIDPGVPWMVADHAAEGPLALALKSGNFGATDFFAKALAMVEPRVG